MKGNVIRGRTWQCYGMVRILVAVISTQVSCVTRVARICEVWYEEHLHLEIVPVLTH